MQMAHSKKLTIQTTRFGEVEVDESLVFDFVNPIIGYPEHKRFTLVDHKVNSPFKWLQSIEDKDLAFAVTLCKYFDIEYQFELSDENVELLGIQGVDDILALNIATIPQDCPQNATINLLAPIIINVANNKAMQVVLKNSSFDIRHPLFQGEKCSF